MTIRKSKPERRRERDRDVSNRHHRHRSGHSYRNSVEYWRQAELRGINSRNSQRLANTSSSSSSGKSTSPISDSYPYPENYGWPRSSSQAGESEDDTNQEINIWHDGSDQDGYADKNNSDDEYRKSYSQRANSEKDYEFVRRLREEKGYEIRFMADDGACLFRAVAHHIFGDSTMHEEVRRLTVDYLSLNRDYFSQFITEDFDHYVERKRKNDCYGNHVELQAISEMYNRPLEIYRYSTEPQLLTPQMEPANVEMVAAPIRLSYHQEGHYNAVVDPFTATIGVGLGLPGHQPGSADRLQVDVAKKESELLELEEAMLKDKMMETNHEAVQEQIEKQVATESLIEWLKKKGGCSVSDSKDGNVGPSRSSTSEQRCKAKAKSPGASSSSCGVTLKYKEHCSSRSPNSYPSQSSPLSPHSSHVPSNSKSHPCAPIPSCSGSKRRSSRSSPPNGSCSPSAYGATAAVVRVTPTTSPKSVTSPAHTNVSETWSGPPGVHFDETASLMNGSLPTELKDWDDFILHQVLVESQREYWLQLTRDRDRYPSGNEQSSSVNDEQSNEAGCSKN